MSWSSVFAHDLGRGLVRKRAVVPFLQFFAMHFFFWLWAREMAEKISLGDFLFHVFAGVPVLRNVNGDSVQVPTLWLQTFCCSLYLYLSYPLNDLTKEGEQILVRSGSRRRWFLSKCAWCLLASVFYYGSALASGWIMVLVTGGDMALTCNPYFVMISSELPMRQGITNLQLAQALVVLPLLTISALNLLQMILSFWIKPIYSFLTCVTLLGVSVFVPSGFLLGNGAMLMRSSLFFEGEVSALHGGLTALAVIILCVPIGLLRFQKYDILPPSGGMTI